MPTRNVNLTDELDHFVLQKVESGRYENASEVVVANRTSFGFNVFMFWGCLNEISGVTCH